MRIGFDCQYDSEGRLIGRYPWPELDAEAVGSVVTVRGCRGVDQLRASASKWGRRTGGLVKVASQGDGSYACTLVRASVTPRGRGQPCKYEALRRMRPGDEVLIPWEPDGKGGRNWRAVDAAIARYMRGREFYRRDTSEGVLILWPVRDRAKDREHVRRVLSP